MDSYQVFITSNELMEDADYEHFFELINLASQNNPPQYILGKAWFYGRQFKVTKDTLIPRQETEELVSKVLRDITNKRGLDVLDIGTGTGDIIITLALENNQHNCVGSDISSQVLKVAQANAKEMNANVSFVQSDLFQNITDQFDVIISNPPYISKQEKKRYG